VVDVFGMIWTGALALWCVAWCAFCLLALGYGRSVRTERQPAVGLSLASALPHLHKLGLSEAWRLLPASEEPTLMRLNLKPLASSLVPIADEPSFLDEAILIPGPIFLTQRPHETLLYADDIGRMGEWSRRSLPDEGETRPTLRAS